MLRMHPTLPITQFGKILGSLVKILKRGHQPNVITLTTLIKGGEVQKTLNFHDHVVAQGFHLNQVSYGTLINVLCEMLQTRAALKLLRWIEGKLLKPNVVMYKTIIDRLCEDKFISDTRDLSVVQRICPDIAGYTSTSLMHDSWIAGQLRETVGLLNDMVMKSINPNFYTFNILVDALCKQGNVKAAKNVVAVMIKGGVKPDVVTYNSLIDGYCLLNEMNKAKDVFNTMAQSGVTPNFDIYSVMIGVLCEINMVDEAMNLYQEMHCKKMNLDLITYCDLIDSLCKLGKISYAWEFVYDMRDRDQLDSIITHSSLLHTLCENHQLDKAIALVKKIEDEGVWLDLDTYYILIVGLCKGGRLKIAQEVFQDLLIKGYRASLCYNIMIHGLREAGLFDDALTLLSKMETKGCIFYTYNFEIVIRALFENGQNGKAEKLFHEMIARGLLRTRLDDIDTCRLF